MTWIDIKEELPDQTVLITDGTNINLVRLMIASPPYWSPEGVSGYDSEPLISFESTTHWRHLPELP